MSLLQQGEQLLEENGDVLLSLQRAHERAVKENVKMAAEISRLQQRLQKLEPESIMSTCLDEPTTGFFSKFCGTNRANFTAQPSKPRRRWDHEARPK